MTHETKASAENQFWLTVTEAADVLGIKRRRMLDYRGKIHCRRVDNPRSGKSYLMFEKGAVEAFRNQRELAKSTGLGQPNTENDVVTVRSKPDSTVAAILQQALVIGAALQQQATAVPAPSAAPAPLGLFLDLDQASGFSGLSQRALRSMIRSGELKARRDGREWKVRQSALLALGETAQS